MVETPRTSSSIEAVGIGKAFGTFRALEDVSLRVGSGEFVTLLGPSGSGKTTFLMMLAGFEAPTAGRLLCDGADITALPAERRAFGMVFQGYALFPHMSVHDNIAFPLRVRRQPADEIRRRVGAMIERVGLSAHAGKRPSRLSGGQQQRVALARALVFEPSVLLLDEPFSALDKHLRGAMQEEVARLHREFGTTFVFVTHDQGEALALSSRVAIFDHGRLLQVGTPQEVYEHPQGRFVAEFLGEVNLLPLSEVGQDGVRAGGRFEDGRLGAPARAGVGRDAILAVRPEHLRLHPAGSLPAHANAVPVRIASTTYLGARTRILLRTGGGVPLGLTLPTDEAGAALAAGPEAVVAWAPEHGFLLPADETGTGRPAPAAPPIPQRVGSAVPRAEPAMRADAAQPVGQPSLAAIRRGAVP